MSSLWLLLLVLQCQCFALGMTTDTSTLMALKTHITHSGSNNLLNNWNISTPVCGWIGVACSIRHQRVIALDIHGMGLSGTIPPHMGNLSFLVKINIGDNHFHGLLPKEMARLRRLEFIDVSSNSFAGNIPSWFGLLPRIKSLFLSENEFVGHIPPSLFNCSLLEDLATSRNPLNPEVIPQEIGKMQNLKYLAMRSNQLTGSIPLSIFNISSLEYFDLAYNSLTGSIPSEIGNCTRIEEIILAHNYFTDITSSFYYYSTGEVPESVTTLGNLKNLSFESNGLSGHVPAGYFNISTLKILALGSNNLSGDLPQTIGSGMPNLRGLYLGDNGFTGSISGTISNASKITLLSLAGNRFTGSVPLTLGKLRYLQQLSMAQNNLVISNGEFTMFIDSLTNCRRLIVLAMNENSINGILPPSFGNLSISFLQFGATKCGIFGKVPQGIGNLSNLIVFSVDRNYLVGPIPKTLERLSNLQGFTAMDNSLSGPIPNEICNLLTLDTLALGNNNLTGPLPACLGNVSALRNLYLGANKFSSEIPASIWNLKDILVLDLSSNAFTGNFSPEIGSFRALTGIDLSRNQLSGHIPSTVGSLKTLVTLYLYDNRFQGSIPESLGMLVSMEDLDLSNNDLSGNIPKSLEALSMLKFLNLSFNRLSGEIPFGGPFGNLTYVSFESNPALCGPPQFRVQPCPQKHYSKNTTGKRKGVMSVYLVIGMSLLGMILLAALFLLLKCRNKHQVSSAVDLQLATTHERISYHELLQATNSFDSSNLLGVGSFGSVYKGVFANGRILAVKVFNSQTDRAMRSFDVECEMLRNIRHRNLVKIVTSCSNLDFMALVLEYMSNGSLDKWLYSHNFFLDVKQRLDIMIDVAYALAYLHHGYSVPVVHCDLKPSNILLDEEMVAHVSDFGIAKFLKEGGNGAQTETLATIGYTAPEYGREGLVSTSSDVYSFGIILMEVFTRKSPTDEMFGLDLSLKSWVSESLQRGVIEVIDENLIGQVEDEGHAYLECISFILELATICSADSPDERITMEDVITSLEKIKCQIL